LIDIAKEDMRDITIRMTGKAMMLMMVGFTEITVICKMIMLKQARLVITRRMIRI